MYRTLKRPLLALAVTAAAVAAGSLAYAAKGGLENDAKNDALAITQARIPLSQAIAIAEQHANGKAARAEHEHTKQGWVHEVEVVSGNQVFEVRIDANQGTVLSSVVDTADHHDRHENHEDHEDHDTQD